jgi:hypothetical protein
LMLHKNFCDVIGILASNVITTLQRCLMLLFAIKQRRIIVVIILRQVVYIASHISYQVAVLTVSHRLAT